MAAAAPFVPLGRAPEGVSDALLVERLRHGDRASLGELYDRHAEVLLATAIRMLGGTREANDLLHDVFLEAWEHAAEYDARRASVRTWLLVRLRSRALDRLGRVEVKRGGSLDELDGEWPTTREDAPGEKSVDRIAVRQALSRLDERVRDVLALTYFDGLVAREIAERLGLPLGTVKSRLARGLSVLQGLLGPEGRRPDAE